MQTSSLLELGSVITFLFVQWMYERYFQIWGNEVPVKQFEFMKKIVAIYEDTFLIALFCYAI